METTDGKVLHKFKLYLPDVKDKLYRLRTIILQVAEKEGCGGRQESLKLGRPIRFMRQWR